MKELSKKKDVMERGGRIGKRGERMKMIGENGRRKEKNVVPY